MPTEMDDLGLFGPDSVAWRVHADPAMVLGGLRALLLQTCHPVVMAGFAANSDYRHDFWGRLGRTGSFVDVVTYGTRVEAEQTGKRIRAVHARLAPLLDSESGRAWRIDDPELLRWVHCAEVDSFLSTYRRCGGSLDEAGADRYVAEMRESARLVGLDSVPETASELAAYFDDVRPQLRVTPQARDAVRWGVAPTMPLWVTLATPARVSWAGLVATAAAMLPRWARRLYRLPGLPTTDVTASLAGRVVRAALLAVPERVRASPTRQAALQRAAGC
ncbi:MAG TPA: oxygenase MpaB family protein [Acidothermales bacterium]